MERVSKHFNGWDAINENLVRMYEVVHGVRHYEAYSCTAYILSPDGSIDGRIDLYEHMYLKGPKRTYKETVEFHGEVDGREVTLKTSYKKFRQLATQKRSS